jgi:RHS repeat-associated protein
MFMSSENQLQAQRWRIASDPTNYLYDGADALEEADAGGTVLARFSQGQNIDEPLAEQRSATTSYYQVDGLGSITSLSSTSATIADAYVYDALGDSSASTGSVTNPFRYTGRESDSETGLYYYRARYYDPQTGRFISADPIRFAGGNDFYGYVWNDPVNYADPLACIIHQRGIVSKRVIKSEGER